MTGNPSGLHYEEILESCSIRTGSLSCRRSNHLPRIRSFDQVVGPYRTGRRQGLWGRVSKHLCGYAGHDHYIRYFSKEKQLSPVMPSRWHSDANDRFLNAPALSVSLPEAGTWAGKLP
jgi:hypothetical protein